MARATQPSFITELPLKVDSQQNRELEARFQAARQLYNACLNEAIVQVKLIQKSQGYQDAKKIFISLKKQRSEALKKARVAYRYSEYDLHSFVSKLAKASKWIADKVDSQMQQTLATRAFRASEKVLLGRA